MSPQIDSLASHSIRMCQAIASFTEVPGTTTRTFLSTAMGDCYRFLQQEMQALGMSGCVDPAGNLRGIYKSVDTSATRRIVIGSHLDTVPNAGAFDGVLGVVLGLMLVKALAGERLPYQLEVIGFSEEEGVRFRTPFIGSRAFTGTLDTQTLHLKDQAGVSVASAIEAFGLDPAQIPGARFDPQTFAYLEFHIEQGPVLASIEQPLAVVRSISGQSRASVQFDGQANHAGATPMRFRRDALAAAAEWITAVETHAHAVPDLGATVGKLDIANAATNVVPGSVTASLDVRHANDGVRTASAAELLRTAEQIANRRAVRCSSSIQMDQCSVPMDARLTALAEASLHACGVHAPLMDSGAGHDAMIIAPFIPSAMIFLRSPNGISHHPDETVLESDVALALQCGVHFLKTLGSTLP